MNKTQIQRSIFMIAKDNNISVEEVMKEMENCILEARETAFRDQNQKAMNEWKNTPSEGEIPTVYEFIAYMADLVRKS